MIKDHDRSYYVGASDTAMILRSFGTKTFEAWYLEKMGLVHGSLSTDAMMAGTAYEHRILDALDIPGMEKDEQVIKGRLRVNLDGRAGDTIYEVKTYKTGKEFRPSKAYRDQVQVQMFATGMRNAFIVAYPLSEEEYQNFYRDIDKALIQMFLIAYDDEFISKVYIPRLEYVSACLDAGAFPTEEHYGEFRKFKEYHKGLG
jgi:hypothetical protein